MGRGGMRPPFPDELAYQRNVNAAMQTPQHTEHVDHASHEESVHNKLSRILKEEAEREYECFRFFPAGNCLVQCQGTNSLKIQMQRDGDTMVDKLLIVCKGPVDSNGRVPLASNVSVPTAYPSGLVTSTGVDLADSGLTCNVIEGSTGRKIIENFSDLATFATPGYSGILYQMLDLSKFLAGDNYLYFDLRNRDIAKDNATTPQYLYHSISVVLVARKFRGMSGNKEI